VGVVSIALFILISQAAEPIRAELRKGRSASYFVGVPAGGSGARVTAGRSWRALAIDSLGRSWPASAEVAAADAKDAIQWFAVRGELPGDRGELVLREEAGGEASDGAAGVEPLLLHSTSAGIVATAPGFEARFPAEGDLLCWDWGGRFAASVQLAIAAEGQDGSLASRDFSSTVESASSFHATVRRELAGRLWAEFRSMATRLGDLELEVFVGNGADRELRFERVEVRIRLPPEIVGFALGGDGCRPRPLAASGARLEARGGDTLYLQSSEPGRPRFDGIAAAPPGFVVFAKGGALAVFVERFERREPMAIALHRDGNLGIEILADPRPLDPGQAVAARIRLGFIPGQPSPAECGGALARLAEGFVASLDRRVYQRSGALGWLEKPVDLGIPFDKQARSRALRAWQESARAPFGFGYRDDADPPISRGYPSNLEYDAVRAALLAGAGDASLGFDGARAAALHWRAMDRGGPSSRLPAIHARDHRAGAAEEGHVWVQGLLDLSFLTDDRALRRDLLEVGEELAARSSSPDPHMERSLAWPLLALSALEGVAPRRGFRAAADRYARAILELEDETFGVVRVGGREDPSGEGFTWSTWLGGGLLGEALFEYWLRSGSPEARDLLERVGRALVELAYDPRRQAFCRKLVFREGKAGWQWHPEGTLVGVRNAIVLATLARLEHLREDPRRRAVMRAVARSPNANLFREAPARAHWWTLAFRELGAFRWDQN
jgi:hypothetical protein